MGLLITTYANLVNVWKTSGEAGNHWVKSTNCGLAQGNMTWCFHNRGPEYHWIIDLYDRLNLPVLPEVVRAFQKATQDANEGVGEEENR